MENVKDTINEKRQLTRIKEDIKRCLNDFLLEEDLQELKSETQNIYTAFCMYAGKQTFINNFFVVGYKRNNDPIYDLFLLDDILQFYLYLTAINNKIVSLNDFSYFVNIDYNIIMQWTAGDHASVIYSQVCRDLKKAYISSINSIKEYNIYNRMLVNAEEEIITALQASIFYKLQDSREAGIKNTLLSNKNPVGVLSVVNREYKWNIETLKEEYKTKALSLQELPQLTMLCKQNDINTTAE